MYSEKTEPGQGFYWCRPTSKLWRALTSPWTVWVCSNRPVDDSREFTVSQMPFWNSSSDLWFLILKQKSKQTPQKLTFLLPACRNGGDVTAVQHAACRAPPMRIAFQKAMWPCLEPSSWQGHLYCVLLGLEKQIFTVSYTDPMEVLIRFLSITS